MFQPVLWCRLIHLLLIDDAMELKHIFALNCPEANLQIADPEGTTSSRQMETFAGVRKKDVSFIPAVEECFIYTGWRRILKMLTDRQDNRGFKFNLMIQVHYQLNTLPSSSDWRRFLNKDRKSRIIPDNCLFLWDYSQVSVAAKQ